MSNEVKSYVRGRAEAVFGGAIGISIGYDEKSDAGIIALSELEEQLGVNAEIGSTKFYEPQVFLVFNNLHSIEAMRDALDNIEYALKYKHLEKPEEIIH